MEDGGWPISGSKVPSPKPKVGQKSDLIKVNQTCLGERDRPGRRHRRLADGNYYSDPKTPQPWDVVGGTPTTACETHALPGTKSELIKPNQTNFVGLEPE